MSETATATEPIESSDQAPIAAAEPAVASSSVVLSPLEAQTARRVACDAFEACKGDELTFAYLCLKDPRVAETKDALRDAYIAAMKVWFAKWTESGVKKPTALAE